MGYVQMFIFYLSLGRNIYGQVFGNGTISDREPKPVLVASNILQVVVGRHHTVLLTSNNELLAFGLNEFGALGDVRLIAISNC